MPIIERAQIADADGIIAQGSDAYARVFLFRMRAELG
jgi:hypothetical protein